MRRRAKDRHSERGLTLIEVLVAFFILFVVTLAVLQLFSMAYIVNLGAVVRTDLTYRAERTIETIRMQRFLQPNNEGAADPTCCPLDPGSHSVPPTSTCMSFWGSGGVNAVEANAPYILSYTISEPAGNPPSQSVTVVAQPQTTGSNRYLGPAASKAVIYVAQLQ
jgi:Tfp pilus assembly protein PilV